jgi:hypothetical protein
VKGLIVGSLQGKPAGSLSQREDFSTNAQNLFNSLALEQINLS